MYFKLIVKDFHQILDLINSHSLNKNTDFNIAHLFSREEKEGGSYDPLPPSRLRMWIDPPQPLARVPESVEVCRVTPELYLDMTI